MSNDEDFACAFLRRHISALVAELTRMRAALAEVDDGKVTRLDAGKFRANLTKSIALYEHNIAVWTADLAKMERGDPAVKLRTPNP